MSLLRLFLSALILCGVFVGSANARRVVTIPASYVQCFSRSAVEYGVDPVLLAAIAYVESRYHPDAVGPIDPKTGQRAFGLMQIYSTHLPGLKKYGVTKEVLLSEPCTNIRLGAWILSGFQQKYGRTWKAVGAYNTGNLNWKRYEAAASYVGLVEEVFYAIEPLRSRFVYRPKPALENKLVVME